jgi:hypothetical protein
VVLDKEKPGTGSTRGLNLAEVRPTAVHLTAASEWFHKIRHNLLHKPALTGNLCINLTQYSAVTKMHKAHSGLDAVTARIYSC